MEDLSAVPSDFMVQLFGVNGKVRIESLQANKEQSS